MASEDVRVNSTLTSTFFPGSIHGELNPVPQTKAAGDEDSSEEVNTIVRRSIAVVCERTFEKAQDACLALLTKIDDAVVVRRCLGILAEV